MFSKQEYQNRIKRIAAEMTKKGLDALVIIDDDPPIGGSNIRYLTGYYSSFCAPPPPSVAVVVPPDVVLCVHPGIFESSLRAAKLLCPNVKEIISGTRDVWDFRIGKEIKNALDALKGLQGKVGLDGLRNMSLEVESDIRKELQGVNLVEDTKILDTVRMIKSKEECDVIRKAGEIADIGVTAWMDAIEEGKTQYMAAIKGEHASKLQGAMESKINNGAGKPWIWGKYRGSLVYKKGDMASCEFNAIYEGYWGQVNRTVVVGEPSDMQKKIFAAVFDAYYAIKDILKPGIKASELYAAGEKVIKEAGFAMPGMRAGHGLGLNMSEGFDIWEKDQTVIQPGFCVMIHNIITMSDERLRACFGNALLVIEKGCEEVNKADMQMRIK